MTLQTYLYTHIPLSQAMGIKVIEATKEKVILEAPLKENINHKQTAFGGSLHAVATLSCWSLLHLNLPQPVQIVIANSATDYLQPIDTDFQVICLKPPQDIWERFLKVFSAKSKGRINLDALIYKQGKPALKYTGTFVAIK